MAYKINGTTVVDNSRNVCACCVTSCCVTASTRLDTPSGNTASRPGSPATGSLYFDTDEGGLVAYDGSDWAAVGGGTTVDYPLSYTINGGNVGLSQSKGPTNCCCFADGGPSRIYMLPDGGHENWQWYCARAAATSTSYGPNMIGVTTARPTDGQFGVISHYHSINPAFTQEPRQSGSVGIIEWGGLVPSSGVKQLYQTRVCLSAFCNAQTDTYVCNPVACSRMAVAFFDKHPDGAYEIMKTRCYCVEAGTWDVGSYGKPPGMYIPRTSFSDYGYNACCACGYGGRGFQCCGFLVTSGGCYICSNCCYLCCGGLYTISGFKHEYFTTSDCCTTAAASAMTWSGYYGARGHACGWQQPVFDHENCRVIFAVRKSVCYLMLSVHCICGASSGFSNVENWELCRCPHCCVFGGTAYLCSVNAGSYNDHPFRKAVYWKNCLWVLGNEGCFAAVSLSDGCFCAWCICRHNCYQMRVLDFLVDKDDNLRIFTMRDGGTGSCEIHEHELTCASATCPYSSTASSIRTYQYNFLGLKCCVNFCCCPIHLSCITFVSEGTPDRIAGNDVNPVVTYDIINNRVAFNSFFVFNNTQISSYCGFNRTSASVAIPLLCVGCSGTCPFFTGGKHTCITRTFCGCFCPTSCSSPANGSWRFKSGSSRHNTSRCSLPGSCGCLFHVCTSGIALCPGFQCYSPANTITSRACSSCMAFCTTGGIGQTYQNKCCYHLSV